MNVGGNTAGVNTSTDINLQDSLDSGDEVVRKGFRRRLPLYAIYFTGIHLSWLALAMVFDQREIISYLWRGVPLGIFLLASIELTMDIKLPGWYKRWRIPYILFWGSFLLAMVI